jgi:Predicted Zn-dependent protease (DUF2268)
MLINLIPDFLAAHGARDPLDAYHRYLETHRPVLGAYWRNYVLDLESPHAGEVIHRTLTADRRDLLHLLNTVDVVRIAEDTLRLCETTFELDVPVDLYLMIGVGAANAGELVVGGRGMAFVCLEHFTGRPNPETYGLGLDPRLLPLWIAHEVAHAVRYTSPRSEAELARIVADAGGLYDYWESGSRATLRELLVNEGLAVLGARRVAPGFEPWDYLGYTRRQYRRLRELDAFLRRAIVAELDQRALGLRLRYLSGGVAPAQRLVSGRVVPERSGYYVGWQLADAAAADRGIAEALRLSADEVTAIDDRHAGAQSA